MNKTGRRSKITPELIDRICGHIANGAFFRNAVALCGVGASTAYDWLKRGESEAGGLHSAFVEAKKRADASFEQRHIAGINDHSNLSWQASAWMLERRFPERWGRKRVEVTGPLLAIGAAEIVIYKASAGSEARELPELPDTVKREWPE